MSELTEITDMAEDAIIEAVRSEGTRPEHPRWHKPVALTTMIMALLAALGGLLAGITASESLFERTREIIEVSTLEGDRVCVETLKSKHEILTSLGETPDPAEIKRVAAFEGEMRELEAGTARDEALALATANTSMIFAIAVTLLSLGITLGGMAVVIERKWLWAAGLAFGAAGAAGVGLGILSMVT